MDMTQETVEIFGTIVQETDMAILLNDGDIEEWVPKSQVEYDEPDSDTQTIVLMPVWVAEAKEFI